MRLRRTGLLDLPPEMIDGGVLGMSTPAEVETKIRGWVAGRAPKVELLHRVNRVGGPTAAPT